MSPIPCHVGSRMSKVSMIPEGKPSTRFVADPYTLYPTAAEQETDAQATHSSEAPSWQSTGMASTTMEATQLGPALLPTLDKGCVRIAKHAGTKALINPRCQM